MDKIEKLQRIMQKRGDIDNTDKKEMQHNLQKLTARERILLLLDDGSFIEFGSLIKGNGDGVITGYGTVNGRLVFVYSQDYTVNGGALTKYNCEKIYSIMDMAGKMGAPLVQIFDSVGTKLTEGLNILKEYGKILNKNASLSGVIPRIAIVAGACVGSAALNCTMSDFSVIVNNSGEVGLTSINKLIEQEEKYVDKSMYADAENSVHNGNVQMYASDDKEALNIVKKIIEYIPSNNLEYSPLAKEISDLNVLNEKLNSMVRNDECDIFEIVSEISDKASLIEINKEWEKSVMTLLAKINGRTVGIIGNNSKHKSSINMKFADKISRFVKMCDCFNIPIVSLVDTKGFAISIDEENNGFALYASKIVYSLASARVPKVSLIIGEAYGSGYLALASREVAFDITLAWPSAKISLTEPKSLIKTIYREEISALDNPKKEEDTIIKKYIDEVTDPFKAAEKGLIDDIIMPSETKPRLYAVLDMLLTKRELRYPKKHGSDLI